MQPMVDVQEKMAAEIGKAKREVDVTVAEKNPLVQEGF